jgi:hypothetical protein
MPAPPQRSDNPEVCDFVDAVHSGAVNVAVPDVSHEDVKDSVLDVARMGRAVGAALVDAQVHEPSKVPALQALLRKVAQQVPEAQASYFKAAAEMVQANPAVSAEDKAIARAAAMAVTSEAAAAAGGAKRLVGKRATGSRGSRGSAGKAAKAAKGKGFAAGVAAAGRCELSRALEHKRVVAEATAHLNRLRAVYRLAPASKGKAGSKAVAKPAAKHVAKHVAKHTSRPSSKHASKPSSKHASKPSSKSSRRSTSRRSAPRSAGK